MNLNKFDVVLPSCSFVEADDIYLNYQGNFRLTTRLFESVGLSRKGDEILCHCLFC